MDKWSISPGQLEASFARAAVLQREIERKERLLGRRIQVLANGLAGLMRPREMHYRRGIGIHAFAVLCGGEAAKRALNTADLDPGDSDEPASRRISLADYGDYLAFVDRLPKYLDDVARGLEARLRGVESTSTAAQQLGRQLARTHTSRSRKQPGQGDRL
jgi:hypothetical protein